jgi:hypothetical protein
MGPDALIAIKGPVRLPRESALEVRLRIEGFDTSCDEDTIYWNGEMSNATFLVRVPANLPTGYVPGTVSIFAATMLLCRLEFLLEVGQGQSEVSHLQVRERRIKAAFASYASEDRDKVLARIQGMLKVAPQLDVFLDTASLRSGERWEERVTHEIEARDVLYLFWSLAASQSVWVEREWRLGLVKRGLDFIDPVPLEPPTKVPPPPELASLHFNEWTLAFMTRG